MSRHVSHSLDEGETSHHWRVVGCGHHNGIGRRRRSDIEMGLQDCRNVTIARPRPSLQQRRGRGGQGGVAVDFDLR